MLLQKARITNTVTGNKLYTLLPQFKVRDEIWILHGSRTIKSLEHRPTGQRYSLEMVQGLDGYAWPTELLEFLQEFQVFDPKTGLSPILAQADEELFKWLLAVNNQGAGQFLSSLVAAALAADSENYALLRPILLRLKEKYPGYLQDEEERDPEDHQGQAPRD